MLFKIFTSLIKPNVRYKRNLCGKRKWIMKTKQQGYSFSTEGVREMSYCSSLNIPMFFCPYKFNNTLSNSTPRYQMEKKESITGTLLR